MDLVTSPFFCSGICRGNGIHADYDSNPELCRNGYLPAAIIMLIVTSKMSVIHHGDRVIAIELVADVH